AAHVLQGQERFDAHDAARTGDRGGLVGAAGGFGGDEAEYFPGGAAGRASAGGRSDPAWAGDLHTRRLKSLWFELNAQLSSAKLAAWLMPGKNCRRRRSRRGSPPRQTE